MKKGLLILLTTAFIGLFITVSLFTGYLNKNNKVIRVGSQESTEQLLLGEITLLALEDAGFQVAGPVNTAGSDRCRVALTKGDFDLYWEYTSTAWLVHLEQDKIIRDPGEAYQKLKEIDKKNGFLWLDYAPINNTYALMMNKSAVDELAISSLSNLAQYLNNHPNKLVIALSHEFAVRPDGFSPLKEFYQLEFRENNIKIIESEMTYQALRDKDVDIAVGHATDSRIAAYNLVVLQDDKNFFPVYNPAPCIRKEVLDKYPKIKNILKKIAAKLDADIITQLNYQINIENKTPKTVAEEWLKSEGLLKSSSE